jgi:dihydrofolate reductase
VLIVGRKTFGIEDPSLALLPHIGHCRACIVVSKSINQDDLIAARVDSGSEHMKIELLLARSFEEALELARLEKCQTIEQPNNGDDNDDHEAIDHWVAGGEAIYKQALQHPDAMEVQLTHVDMTVDTNQFRDVAFFPLEDMNANGFDEVSTKVDGNCEFKLYRRKI